MVVTSSEACPSLPSVYIRVTCKTQTGRGLSSGKALCRRQQVHRAGLISQVRDTAVPAGNQILSRGPSHKVAKYGSQDVLGPAPTHEEHYVLHDRVNLPKEGLPSVVDPISLPLL